MAKVTSKYQVTPGQQSPKDDRESRLRLFDQSTERQRKRSSARKTQRATDRGWNREDLYRRGPLADDF